MESITAECFLCTRKNNIVPVDEKVVAKVEYIFPEITIIKLSVPLRICSVCDGALYSFNNFKQCSVETSRRLEKRIKEAKPSGPPQTINRQYVTDSEMSDIEDIEEPNLPIENLEYIPFPSDDSLGPDFDNLETESSEIHEQITKIVDDIQTDASEQEKETSSNENKNQEKERKHRCTICFKTFTSKWNLTRHMRLHVIPDSEQENETSEYICEICKKPFCTKWHLSRHMKLHPILFPCKNCWMVFEDESELKTHEENYHSPEMLPKNIQQNTDKNTNKILPKNTDKNTNSSDKNEDENKLKNEKFRGIYQCPICKKICRRKHNLKDHMRTHSEDNFQCYICNKLFRHKHLLIMHTKRVHTDLKKYPCSQCDRSFISTSELYTHLKRHGVLPEFPCQICGKKFTYYSHMKKHEKIHNSDMKKQEKTNYKINDLTCDICNKVFKQKWVLYKHYEIHFEDKEYKCKICDKQFEKIANLCKHMNYMHLK